MMNAITDSTFGDMSYDSSWVREENICIFGREYEVRVVAEAYKEQLILDCQRQAYKKYNEEYKKYVLDTPAVLLKYYLENYDFISSMVDIPERINKDNINKELITKLIKIRTVYFDRKGQYGWLCDCAWDSEHGICILLSDEEVTVKEYDYLL